MDSHMQKAQQKPSESQEPVTADLPYPPIEVSGPNPGMIPLMETDLCSPRSEMTSIMQYLYHSWVFQGKMPEISKMIKRIAEVEMHHMDILGELIVLLGGNPVYFSRMRGRQGPNIVPWNGGMVTYHRKFILAIQDDIALEKAVVATYERQLQNIRDPKITAIISRIIQDEKVHIRLFHSLLEKYSK